MHFTGFHHEVKPVEGAGAAERLDETRDRDRCRHELTVRFIQKLVKLRNQVNLAHVTRKRRDPAAVVDFVERFGNDLVSAGMPRMPARIFAALLSSDDGRTAAELAAQLQASPAAISGGIRYLEQVDMAVRARRAGERRDVYRLGGDMWYEVIANRDRMYARWLETLSQGVEAVGRKTPAGRRIDATRRFVDFVRTEMPAMLARWRAERRK